MFRTQISLSEDDRRILDAQSARSGRSMSALIRDAVHATYGTSAVTDSELAAVAAAFGSWQGRADDGAAWVDGLRSGRRIDRSE